MFSRLCLFAMAATLVGCAAVHDLNSLRSMGQSERLKLTSKLIDTCRECLKEEKNWLLFKSGIDVCIPEDASTPAGPIHFFIINPNIGSCLELFDDDHTENEDTNKYFEELHQSMTIRMSVLGIVCLLLCTGIILGTWAYSPQRYQIESEDPKNKESNTIMGNRKVSKLLRFDDEPTEQSTKLLEEVDIELTTINSSIKCSPIGIHV